VTIQVPPSRPCLKAAVLGLVALNRAVLRSQNLPPLYQSGVTYRPEGLGRERWLRADEVFAEDHGDCEDLAAWRVAELQVAGELGASVDIERTGTRKYHAVVRRADGTREDPSRILRDQRPDEFMRKL